MTIAGYAVHPEDVLFAELGRAYAPITKRHVACVIVTQNGVYGGHNVEGATFRHAERMALRHLCDAQDYSHVREIRLTGAGQKRLKDVAPCTHCFDALRLIVDPTTELVLLDPVDHATKIGLPFDEVVRTYGGMIPSDMSRLPLKIAREYLHSGTVLSNADLEMVLALRTMGVQEQVSFFLTGTASGRGGINQIIQNRLGTTYSDLDLVAVTAREHTAVVDMLQEAIFETGRTLTSTEELSPTLVVKLGPSGDGGASGRRHSPGEGSSPRRAGVTTSFSGTTTSFYDEHGVHRLEITSGRSLAEVMCREDYRKNNWFHQLS